MSLSSSGRPSPALIVAAIALTFAMVGTSVAQDPVAKITKSKVKRIADKQINAAAPGLSVARAVDADKAINADRALTAVESERALRAFEADRALKAVDANNALKAVDADNAKVASNATNLGGRPPSAYLGAADVAAHGNAESDDINNFTSPTYTDVITKAFTAPKAGFAFISGSIGAQDDLSFAGGSKLLFRLALDGTGLTDDPFYHEIAASFSSGVEGGSGGISAVVPVTAGAHTVALQARELGSGSYILGRDISILFAPTGSAPSVPFGPAGGGPASKSPQG